MIYRNLIAKSHDAVTWRDIILDLIYLWPIPFGVLCGLIGLGIGLLF